MSIVVAIILIGTLLAFMLRKIAKGVVTSFLLSSISLFGYAGYTVYMGLFLGGRPAWYYEGKFLVIPFHILAAVGSAFAIAALFTSVSSISSVNNIGEKLRWYHLGSFGAACMATTLLFLLIFYPIGLGVAYEIAELRRSTWVLR